MLMDTKNTIEKAWSLIDRVDPAVLNLFLDLVPLMEPEQVAAYVDALALYATLSDAVKRIKESK